MSRQPPITKERFIMAQTARPPSVSSIPDQLNSAKMSSKAVSSHESLQAAVSALPRSVLEELMVKAAESTPSLAKFIQTYVPDASELDSPSNQHAMAAALPVKNSSKKRGNAEDATKPPAKRAKAKARKPLDFDKLEQTAWNLMTGSVGQYKASRSIEAMADKILAEVDIVDDLQVRLTALLCLGEIINAIFTENSNTNKKQTYISNGTAPGYLTHAMGFILMEMSEEELSEFIASEEGIQWEKKMLKPAEYGVFFTDPQVSELMELFPTEGDFEEAVDDENEGEEDEGEEDGGEEDEGDEDLLDVFWGLANAGEIDGSGIPGN